MNAALQSILDNRWFHAAILAICALPAVFAVFHAILYKRDTRATMGWVGAIIINPYVGGWLYALFGVNRIRRKARRKFGDAAPGSPSSRPVGPCSIESVRRTLGDEKEHLESLLDLVCSLTGRPLLDGNAIRPLTDGPTAYKRMLQAIRHAERSVAICSYIFDNDRAGKQFHQALVNAQQRGVEVRVLIDDVGARYSFPTILRQFQRSKVPSATFMRTLVPWKFPFSNLRNHRKILVVDGRIGFTGGMNIREGYMSSSDGAGSKRKGHSIADLHFRVEGPVVSHLQEVFAVDWEFATGERLEGDNWFPRIEPASETLARGISDGPDDDFDKMRMTILGALDCAQQSLYVVTPYFLPDDSLITSLNVAALRGVDVNIILPQTNNLAVVQWASTDLLWQVLERGCHVWVSPPPFDHTKLMLADGMWTLFGSTNWDPRSLRLNFEFNVECYDRDLCLRLQRLVMEKLMAGRKVTRDDVDGRSLPIRLRDGVARLATPYL